MDIQITQHKLTISDDQKIFLTGKIQKILKAGGSMNLEATKVSADIRLLTIKGAAKIYVEVGISTPGALIRAEDSALTFEAAVDQVESKLGTQLRRFKEKWKKRHKNDQWIPASDLPENLPTDEPKVTKRKRFSNDTPMHEEEAIELMELSGHNFFLFRNIATNRWSVIYKRHESTYGLIEPKADN